MDVWPAELQESPVTRSPSGEQSLPETRHDALLAVQDAVKRHMRDGAPPNTLRPSLEALGNRARWEGMPSARLIVELKQALNQMPVLAALDPLARSDFAAHVMLLAIEAYYGDSANGA